MHISPARQLLHGAWQSFVGYLALSGPGGALCAQPAGPEAWTACPSRELGEGVPPRSQGAAADPISRPLPCPDGPMSNAHRRWARLQMDGDGLAEALGRIDRHRCVDESLLMSRWAQQRGEAGSPPQLLEDGRLAVWGGDTMLALGGVANHSEQAVADARDATCEAIWRRRRIAYAATAGAHVLARPSAPHPSVRWAAGPPAGRDAIVFVEHVVASWGPVALDTLTPSRPAGPKGQTEAGEGLRAWGMEGPLLYTSLSLALHVHPPTEADRLGALGRALQQVAGSPRLMLPMWQNIFRTSAADPAALLRHFGGVGESLRRAGISFFAQQLAMRTCEVDFDAAAAIRCLFARSCNATNAHHRLATLRMDPRTRAWARHIARVVRRHPSSPILVVADAGQIFDLRATFEQSGLASWERAPTGSLDLWGMTNGGASAECQQLLADF